MLCRPATCFTIFFARRAPSPLELGYAAIVALRHRVLVLAIALAAAACGTGTQLGAGPVIGYAFNHGFSAGWEASGGPFTTVGNGDQPPSTGSLITRFSVGMAWRQSARGPLGLEHLTYAAWEPWFLLGATAGLVKVSSERTLAPMLGIWEAAPLVTGGQPGTFLPRCSPCLTLSIAVGWRWSGASDIYLTPKIGFIDGATKPWPFSRYPD